MKKRTLWSGAVSSRLVVGYVLIKLDWHEVSSTFRSLNWNWVLLAFLVYLVNYLLRGIRFRYLLSLKDIPFHKVLGVTNLYGMYLYLLPAKFGEVSFPVLVKNRLDVDISTSTGSLIVARVFDFLTIALLLPIALIIYWDIVPVNFRILSIVFSVLVFISYTVFIWLLRNSEKNLSWFEMKGSLRPTFQKVKDFIVGVYRSAQTVDQRQQYWRLLLITIGIWICVNSNFYLITLALGYRFNFFQIVIVSIIMVPVTLFPIQGFANLGAHELGWVTAFTLFGYQYLDALNIAVSSHIVYVFFVILLGLSGFLLSTRNRVP